MITNEIALLQGFKNKEDALKHLDTFKNKEKYTLLHIWRFSPNPEQMAVHIIPKVAADAMMEFEDDEQ